MKKPFNDFFLNTRVEFISNGLEASNAFNREICGSEVCGRKRPRSEDSRQNADRIADLSIEVAGMTIKVFIMYEFQLGQALEKGPLEALTSKINGDQHDLRVLQFSSRKRTSRISLLQREISLLQREIQKVTKL